MNPRKAEAIVYASWTLFVLCALAIIGCAGNVATTPTTPKTPLQWVQVYNAALATGNDTFAKEVISIQQSGVITAAQAKPLLSISLKIAQTSQSIRTITTNKQPWSAQAPQISSLLTQLGADVALQNAGTSNAQVTSAIQGILATITLIRGQVQ